MIEYKSGQLGTFDQVSAIVWIDVGLEFHYLIDELGVDGELLHAGWAEHMIKLLYPMLGQNLVNQLINHWGWH